MNERDVGTDRVGAIRESPQSVRAHRDAPLQAHHQPYPAYKPSGVAWLGDVPAHWEVMPLKHALDLRSGESPPSDKSVNGGEYEIYGANGIIGYCSSTNISRKSIVIGRVGSSGEINIVGPNCWVSDNALIVTLRETYLDFYFAYYLLKAMNLGEWASKNAQPLITSGLVKNKRFAMPRLPEQRAIAAYLDRETARIDALLAKNERLIELLQEKRTALISHAVTRGLDANAPLKDSGVPWLGDVPKHWKVKRLKQLVSRIGSGKTPLGGAQVYKDSGVMLLRSQNIHFDGLRLEDVAYIDEITDSEMSSTRVLPNDVLLNITGASLGRCSIVPESFPPANVNQHVCIVRPDCRDIEPRFLHSVMSSAFGQMQIFSSENGTSREGLTFSQIANFVLTVPSLNEQRAIAAYLERETAKIDALIGKVRQVIEKLQEYRTALISAAVTGKIDVTSS